MDVSSPIRRLTAEDLPHEAPEEGLSELVHGEILREPSPGEEHGWVGANLLIPLGRFIQEHRLGRVYLAETGFVLARDPDTVRAPDIAFVSQERLDAEVRRGPYFEGAPDLAVEVLSPGNSPREIGAKVRDFLAAGSRAVWVVDPSSRTVTVHQRDCIPETLLETDVLDGGSAVPGFRLPVRAIFEK